MALRYASRAILAVAASAFWCADGVHAQVGVSNGVGSGAPRGLPFGAGMSGGAAAYNPFMNPTMMPYTTNPDAMWYLYATNQYYGGSIPGTPGVRPTPAATQAKSNPNQAPPHAPTASRKAAGMKRQDGRRPGTRPPAEMPLSSTVPGSSAAGYFFRGTQSGNGAGRYYNRAFTPFQNNGR